MTCEEFNFKHAFAEGTLEVTKLLFEGEGASIRKDLYAMFQKAYKDVIFCVASNKPMTTMIEMAETQDSSFKKNVWEPLESRVDFIHMEKSHSSKVDFPYTTCHLANALYFLA